ncbi:RabGAP/TBC [Phellopilus nigrolimitatus]|nr:RabGAP/TBC [Phellopilus nigrolimitatus]
MIEMTRPPPARPHIGLNTPARFSSYASVEWAEEDAWDSASDSESPPQKHPNTSRSNSIGRIALDSSTTARPVPKPKKSPSSSSLAFSYTHVSAPNPGSYSPRPEQLHSHKTSWTMVSKSSENGARGIKEDEAIGGAKRRTSEEFDIEDIVVADTDAEASDPKPNKERSGLDSVRDDAGDVVQDPLSTIRRRHASRPKRTQSSGPSHQKSGSSQLMRELSIRTNKRNKFVECLLAEDVSIVDLRKLAWNGIPDELRPIAWQLLLGYLPLPSLMRTSTLSRKRAEYASLVDVTFAKGRDGLDQQIWHQIEIDVPRTRPGVKLWMHGVTQRSIERILYVWAIRHPASGYVQGINDLVTPFFQVFLSAYITSDPEEFDPVRLPPSALSAVEADSFWCLSRLLDGIQDNYIFAQPGIQRSVKRMAELVARIDAPLFAHLQSENVEFMQFAFRWMNCLLMREISVKNTVRMWDTYLAEGPDAFSQFHLYVCSAFLMNWSKKLQDMDFQGIIMFLQSLPTQNWGDHEIELLLSHAFVLNSTWQNAQSHFLGS